jgi:hypothetical protein
MALAVRWAGPASPLGPAFMPRRDALEYGAAAQGIAQAGRYFLQLGPFEVQPLHAPGWPMLVAAATRAGLAASEAWRLAGAGGALTAAVLAVLAGLWTRRLRPLAVWAPRLAALAAGGLWAFAPLPAYHGSVLLSDEPAVLIGMATLLLTSSARDLSAAALAGSGLALLAAMRPASAVLLAPALLIAAKHGGRLRALAAGTGSALPVFALVGWLLYRSGYEPWHWTAFELWNPDLFGRLGNYLDPRFAIAGSAHGGASHLVAGLSTLLGLGVPASIRQEPLEFGLLWPAVGWLVAAWLAWRFEQRALVWAVGSWVGATLAFHSSFYWLTPRYYLPLLWVPALGAGVGLGWLAGHPNVRARAAAAIAAVLLLAVSTFSFRRYANHPFPAPVLTANALVVDAWIRQTDAERATRTIPFDPLEAQALGLLGPDRLGGVQAWGELPDTEEVVRLRRLGALPAAQ